MFRRNDPRLRRTLNQLTQNLEVANEQAQEGLYTFQQKYINPCLSSITTAIRQCAEPCLGTEEERRRRQRARSRGRLEHSFDFYDDWDEEENDLLGWGNDELEHLLADSNTQQPGRERAMSYGTRKDGRPRRKSAGHPHDGGTDPTILPQSSYFGFLDRWKLGGKGLRYKPSAADLQEHPGAFRKDDGADQALLGDSDDEHGGVSGKRHKRHRSHTSMSGTDSLSSRGDLFPSEDEDDAVPLDDEFAINLERRTTGHDESSSGKTRSDKSARRSRLSTRTASSRSARDVVKRMANVDLDAHDITDVPTLQDLHAEEAQAAEDEESAVEKKRTAAQRLALERGLSSPSAESKPESARASSPHPPVTELSSKSPSITGVVPFPKFDPNRTPGQTTPSEENEDPVAGVDKRDSAVESSDAEQSKDAHEETFVPAALPRFSPHPD